MSYAKQSRYFEAENRLRQADNLAPGNPRIEYNLAVAMNQNGQSEDAKALVERLLLKQPNDPNLMISLGDIEFSLGQPHEAKERLKFAFKKFRDAGNATQAARLARSVANLAFLAGNEQEALCYSYEAWTLAPIGEQLGWHARLLIAQNYPTQAEALLKTAVAANRTLTQHPGVQHAIALARYARGDYVGALEAEDLAVDLIPTVPELGSEVNAAHVLMKQKVDATSPASSEAPDDEGADELERQRLEEALQFKDRALYEIIMWPPGLRAQLNAMEAPHD